MLNARLSPVFTLSGLPAHPSYPNCTIRKSRELEALPTAFVMADLPSCENALNVAANRPRVKSNFFIYKLNGYGRMLGKNNGIAEKQVVKILQKNNVPVTR